MTILKLDVMGQWIENEWIPYRTERDLQTLWIPDFCVHEMVLSSYNRDAILPGGYTFVGVEQIECPAVTRINNYNYRGEITRRTGAFIYKFEAMDIDEVTEILILSSYFTDDGRVICLACVPETFMIAWAAFSKECERIFKSLSPRQEVIIIGGRTRAFVPTVEWDDIVLPESLKNELFEDVRSFFTKGIDVYQRLKLKPFRKLLLAGIPGTGKTMLCNAIAKWAIEQQYLVIYISSADQSGATFSKIQQALHIASNSSLPTLILLEELDAYLHKQEKALVLNVLDGSESLVNDYGTLLIATTNYPEAIDERVLKRPGRLDRIFIIPEIRTPSDAEKMLRQYLGEMWHEDHLQVSDMLVGYPGAFIREVAVYALTHVAYENLDYLPLDLLLRSFERLKEQVNTHDAFVLQQQKKPVSELFVKGDNDEE
ncbi:MAG: hypothetical protein Kow00117_16960 [Phototrophicales bacterium]